MNSETAPRSANVAKAFSMSRSLLASTTRSFCPLACTAACTSLTIVEAEQSGGRFDPLYEYRMRRISRLLKDCNPYSLRHDLLQQFQSLHCQFRGQDG